MRDETRLLDAALQEVVADTGAVDPGRQVNLLDAIGAYRLLLGRNPSDAERRTLAESRMTFREFLTQLTQSPEFASVGGVMPPNRLLMAEVEGFRFWFRTGDREMGVPMALGRYEPDSVKLFQRLVQPGMRCVDVGAQTGFFTCLMASLVGPTGSVDAIEPMPDSFDLLQRNIRENGWSHARAHHLAASSQLGVIEMSCVSQMYVAGRIEGAEVTTVPARRLDDLVTGPVDLVKLDIEGHEPAALRGMEETIGRCRPILISECNEYWLRTCSGITSGDYCRQIESMGYALFNAKRAYVPMPASSVRLEPLETMDVIALPL